MTLHTCQRTLLLTILFVLAATFAARADDMASGPYGSIRLDVGKTYVNLPAEGAVITWFAEPYGKTENRFWGENIEVVGALRLPGLDTTPRDNTRFEAAVNYLTADATTRETGYPFLGGTVPLGFLAINGSGVANGTLGLMNTAVFATDYKQWGFDLKLIRDQAVDGMASLSLYAGLTYFNTDLSNDFDLVEDGVTIPIYLEDETTTDYDGIRAGGDAAFPLGSDWVLDMGGRLELLYADASMSARQNLNFFPPFNTIGVDDSDDKLAGRVQARMGLRYDLHPAVFGIGASASYLSYQPYAKHPDSNATALVASHIEDDDMFSFALNMSVSVVF
jgi:hypothetical protein